LSHSGIGGVSRPGETGSSSLFTAIILGINTSFNNACRTAIIVASVLPLSPVPNWVLAHVAHSKTLKEPNFPPDTL